MRVKKFAKQVKPKPKALHKKTNLKLQKDHISIYKARTNYPKNNVLASIRVSNVNKNNHVSEPITKKKIGRPPKRPLVTVKTKKIKKKLYQKVKSTDKNKNLALDIKRAKESKNIQLKQGQISSITEKKSEKSKVQKTKKIPYQLKNLLEPNQIFKIQYNFNELNNHSGSKRKKGRPKKSQQHKIQEISHQSKNSLGQFILKALQLRQIKNQKELYQNLPRLKLYIKQCCRYGQLISKIRGQPTLQQVQSIALDKVKQLKANQQLILQ